MQGPNEPPSVFLERLLEAFRRYTPFDPTSEAQKASMALAFIGQSALDIRKKLQRLEGLQEAELHDLVKEAEKLYYKRETEEEREQRKEREILGKLGHALDSQGTWAIGPHSTRTNVHIVKEKDTGQGTAPRRETKD